MVYFNFKTNVNLSDTILQLIKTDRLVAGTDWVLSRAVVINCVADIQFTKVNCRKVVTGQNGQCKDFLVLTGRATLTINNQQCLPL